MSPRSPSSATPPTTPPTIAPVLEPPELPSTTALVIGVIITVFVASIVVMDGPVAGSLLVVPDVEDDLEVSEVEGRGVARGVANISIVPLRLLWHP
jgi:hypothetical protein